MTARIYDSTRFNLEDIAELRAETPYKGRAGDMGEYAPPTPRTPCRGFMERMLRFYATTLRTRMVNTRVEVRNYGYESVYWIQGIVRQDSLCDLSLRWIFGTRGDAPREML